LNTDLPDFVSFAKGFGDGARMKNGFDFLKSRIGIVALVFPPSLEKETIGRLEYVPAFSREGAGG
jgi:hypothetical protein